MNVIRETSNENPELKKEVPAITMDTSPISDVQNKTNAILDFIEESTDQQVGKYQEVIGENLEFASKNHTLEQQHFFRFITNFLLRENIKTGLKYNDYETYLLEKNITKRRKEDQENQLGLSHSVRKAQKLCETLAPIHNRLMRIELFFDNLQKYDVLPGQTDFTRVYKSNIKIIYDMSKQLISDKGDLNKLEEDAKIMRNHEKEIIAISKKSYILYMLQIYKTNHETKELFNQGSKKILIYDDYKDLQNLFINTVKNSEDFWNFHEKFFSKLVELGLREERRKKKK